MKGKVDIGIIERRHITTSEEEEELKDNRCNSKQSKYLGMNLWINWPSSNLLVLHSTNSTRDTLNKVGSGLLTCPVVSGLLLELRNPFLIATHSANKRSRTFSAITFTTENR